VFFRIPDSGQSSRARQETNNPETVFYRFTSIMTTASIGCLTAQTLGAWMSVRFFFLLAVCAVFYHISACDAPPEELGELSVLFRLPFVLSLLAWYPSESIWNCGSRRQLAGIVGRPISPSQGRYLRRTTQTQNQRGQISMSQVGFEPTIPVFKRPKTVHALDPARPL
jgi:hypothetical protein